MLAAGSVRSLLAGLMEGCGPDAAGLVAGYAWSAGDEGDHDAFLSGDWDGIRDPVYYAAAHGSLLLLQWARAREPWDATTGATLVRGGNLGVLRWAHEEGCLLGPAAATRAAEAGNLLVLRWVHAVGIRLAFEAFGAALVRQHAAVFQWLLAHTDPAWGALACRLAATQGRLADLEFLDANGVRPDPMCCHNSSFWGHFGIFRWVHLRGCLATDGMCYSNFQRVVLAALADRYAARRGALLGLGPGYSTAIAREYESVATPQSMVPFEWVESCGVRANPRAAHALRLRVACGVPGTPEEWDALQAAIAGVFS